ncbi:DNA-processing protein DprA [Crossiella cryophila]|uniref:DNA processing protein n=1 Tax=Crossiella cryophila TaxID=43355 RepID=A0A7W7CMB6_9PSEU|nr:DNA-processing protein DprA [Crossiella cryophila]MBB4682039.1 DNA processing protein [Crossiella cryophila]
MSADDPRLRLARAYLSRVAEPPAPALHRLVTELGAVAAADQVHRGDVPPPVSRETEARRTAFLPREDLAAAEALNARLLIPEDPDWPSWQFSSFAAAAAQGAAEAVPPLALWVRGEAPLAELVERAVAIVGSRSATPYGETIATELGIGLAELGVTVVSGAAMGIDGAAHRGAIIGNGPTVAVVACGLDIPYPAGHVGLLRRIVSHGGLILSEYPPGVQPAKHRFLVRNRLIAALGGGTVVVEAGIRSGATNTAAHTRTLGRPLMAVPGPVNSAMSVGCLALLRSGHAVPVGTAAQVIEASGRIGIDLSDTPEGPRRETDGLEPHALRVHEALPERSGLSAEEVAVESGLPLSRVRGLLPALELAGLAQRGDEGWHRLRANR